MTQMRMVEGIDPKTDTFGTATRLPKRIEKFKAAATIDVGMAVMHDTASATDRATTNDATAYFANIVIATTATAGVLVGVYEGSSGATGAATTASGQTGLKAATSDIVDVVVYGCALAQTNAKTAANMIPGANLSPSTTTAGALMDVTAVLAGGFAPIILGVTGTFTAATLAAAGVVVRCG